MSRIWKTCTELLLLTPKRKLKRSEGAKENVIKNAWLQKSDEFGKGGKNDSFFG